MGRRWRLGFGWGGPEARLSDERRDVAGPLEQGRVRRRAVGQVLSNRVVEDAVKRHMHAEQERSACRRTHGRGGVRVCEDDAFLRKPIRIR